MTVHQFTKSLAWSHQWDDAPWWDAVYRSAFPRFHSMQSVREDGWAQRGGIDRLVHLTDGTAIKIDEKVREKDWPDILLEVWSDKARRHPGWIKKSLTCDYIAYAFVPSATCYLLPFLPLQRAYEQNKHRWANDPGCRTVSAQNQGYVTVSVAVPIHLLLDAIRDSLVVSWLAAETA